MLLADGSVRRSSDLLANGVRPQAIANALKAGVIARADRGTYHLVRGASSPEEVALAAACARMPEAVVCMLSAAWMNNLLDDPPPVTWIALPLRVHAARVDGPPRRTLRWSYEGAFDIGVEVKEVCGVPVRRTNAARTLVDLVRYERHLSGRDIGPRAAARFFAAGGTSTSVTEIAEAVGMPRKSREILDIVLTTLAVQP
ncbi:type IV toxin-antitoxin system AbiEi family antitoxin domain-containing protein [Muricoccus nepalensis]|uniref:type IV toxin-antitoxin system AbiEi family antitoxin domain-containing protein n=1 Tax=Muricoccus nepalensis TaxID=1854500 RepID=UPI001126DF15|nr:type IV toxin-antitoxin system AbiEi family antitoxin domain-containing protein [Roseomonas nepalensis]